MLSTHPDSSVHSQILPEDQGAPIQVSMNPLDADERELSEGYEVYLVAGKGRLAARVRLDPGLARGVLHCYQGGWIKFGQGVNQVVPDILTRQGLCAGFHEAIVEIQRRPKLASDD